MRSGVVVVAAALAASGCGLFSRAPAPVPAEPGATQIGIASWYGPGFHGRPTSSGEIYDQYELTAAHPTLPHGTRVRVTNLTNEREVIVRINDRGPFVDDRVVDLSYAAARQLDMIGPGTVAVRLEVLDPNLPIIMAAPRPPPQAAAPPALRPVVARAVPAAVPLAAARYSVQVGTFANYDRARRTQRTLGSEIAQVHLALVDAPRARYYQVRVGPFASSDEALRTARRIADLGFPALVVSSGR